MAITQDTYNGNGSNLGPFLFTFKWLESTDIKVSVGGVLKTAGTHYNLQNLNYNPLTGKTGGEVLFTAGNAPPTGTNNIRIYRDTDDEALSAVFSSGSAIRAKDLNDNFTQNLYVTQEVNNNSLNVDGSNPMVGPLNMNGFQITNLPVPAVDTNAATKKYVDDRFGNLDIPGHTRWRKVATASQTIFSGTGDYGGVLTYSATREQVYINGALQQRGVDYAADNGTSVVFTVGLTVGDVVDIICVNNLTNSSVSNAANITYSGQFTGQTARPVAAKLGDVVSVKDFGAVGDNGTDNFSAILAAWNYALLSGKNLYFPEGTYVINGDRSFPIGRVNGLPPTSMLDCKNITVYGDGPATILKTISAGGADVLQLNGAKNLHIRDLAITAALTGSSGAGSNGISITGGGENLSFTRIQVNNLPYVEYPSYLDGGKAFSLQLSGFTGPAITVGTITFTDCVAKGCVYGFDHNPILDDCVGRAANVSFNNCTAEDCWYGFIMSTAASGVALPEGFNSGISFADIRSINCQHSAVLARNHGGVFKFFFKNTKTQADLKLNPSGIAWSTTLSTTVDGLTCLYAHNSKITANGYLNSVEYKARIGGTSQGSSGLSGATFNCDINLDLGGTATIADIQAIDAGGNTLRESTLVVSATTTASALPADFYLPANQNHVEHVASTLFVPTANAAVASIKFPSTFVDSADANTLDDYEEGFWTPLLFDLSLTSEGATYSVNSGKYTKIGNVVFFNLFLAMSGLGSLTTSDSAFIGGLPFTSRLQTGNISAVTVGYAASLALSSAATLNARIGANENYITLSKWGASSTTGSTPLTVGEVSASGTLLLSGFYFT